ncbi:MAG: hypothetical protein K0R17_1067 [Rariglobus sp.]|nr:hypothetical protein [Rariglobus sp.]
MLPMPDPVIRIFSDLHYRDGHSGLHQLEALRPLLAGADHVVLNGDTLDTLTAAALPHLAEVRTFFEQNTPRVTFLSGNHDPRISTDGELSLHDDRIWITHGDVLFDEIAPWSSLRDEMVRRLKRLVTEVPPTGTDVVGDRLRRNRIVCDGLPEPHDHLDRSLLTRALRFARALLPPRRLLIMLRAWRTAPALARRLARAHRPRARLVLLGHTHYPGVWRDRDGPVIVNTGSFCGPFGGLFVEVCGDRVEVVRIVQKQGEFHRGRVVAGFSLAP